MAGGIKGEIVNRRNDQPIPRVKVSVSGRTNKSTTTNDKGEFQITGLAAGVDYKMNISAPGFEKERYEAIVVIDGGVTDLKLGMTVER